MKGSTLALSLAAALAVAVACAAPSMAGDDGAGPHSAPVASAPRGQIQGSAIVRRNVPVVGAVVTLWRAEERSDLRVTTTDERGAFRIGGLEDGRYRVEVAHDDFATLVKERVELRAPFRAVVEVTMAPSPAGAVPAAASAVAPAATAGAAAVALRGVVRDREGRGAGEIRLRVVREDGSEDPQEGVTTAEGRFAFDGLTPGRWRVELRGAGMLPLRTTVALSEETTLWAVLVPQPVAHAPAIEDLMPREEPVLPR